MLSEVKYNFLMAVRMFALRFGAFSLAVGTLLTPAVAQLRVMTYNVTNYSSGRVVDIQNALFAEFQGRSAKPDLFLGQEFLSATGLANFMAAMNSAPGSTGTYAAAPFIDGPDTDSVVIFRNDKLVLDGTVVVAVGGSSPKQPRNIMRYDLHLKGYSLAATQFSVYSVHMKAGTTNDDKARRLLEAQLIRDDAESLGRPFILGGDFNIQHSNETSFVELTGSQANNVGRFTDPIKSPGGWNHTVSFRFVHTQDPATSGAGMDDRFDFLLLSSGLVDGNGFEYIGNPNIAYSTSTWNDPNHSYRCWGNDGTSFDLPLTVTGNQMVGPTIAQALINSTGGQSGHLPVLLDLKVPAKVSATTSINFGTLYLGQNTTRVLAIGNGANVALWNLAGIDTLDYSLTPSSGFTVAGGPFTAPAGVTNNHNVGINTSTPGLKTGTITVTTDDPENPVVQVQVSAYVLPFKPNGFGDTIN